MARLLVLGAGYIGARLGELALAQGHEVVLADNWFATSREQLAPLEAAGARVETADVRDRGDLERLLAERPERLYLLAAQASRPLSLRQPDYTEETNVSGTRRAGDAAGRAAVPLVVFGSSLHVYGGELRGEVGTETPYGRQRDLAHLSKIYGEQALAIAAARDGFGLSVLRLGIVYGPSPVEHDAPESQTVVDKFRRLAAAGADLPVDAGAATIGVVHVDDVARILLVAEPGFANVAAETVTVADVAALARGEPPAGEPAFTVASPFTYRHRVAEYLRS
ncbi:MAG TPA: NAD(P)-dependent oxidoreductase [Gaiellaceae bacterium]|nr:NAD(P)-dependent oxidoreductase [Gaiellaceae bacterium]